MIAKTLANYGGPFVNAVPVINPQSQISEAKLNRALEDTAQMTRTAIRAMVHFHPRAASDPDVLWHWSVWGSSPAEAPTITRQGVGLYRVTYPTSFTDPLNVVETVTFSSGMTSIMSANADKVVLSTIVNNVINLVVRNAADAASDLTDVETIILWLR